MLVKASPEFADYIFHSAHYLNSPTFILNCDLDSMYRQAKGLNNGKAVEWIAEYLKKYKVSDSMKKAKEFVSFREKINVQEFNKLNVNSYCENLPAHIEKRHNYICDWFKNHTHYYPAIYTGGEKMVKSVDNFPFRQA